MANDIQTHSKSSGIDVKIIQQKSKKEIIWCKRLWHEWGHRKWPDSPCIQKKFRKLGKPFFINKLCLNKTGLKFFCSEKWYTHHLTQKKDTSFYHISNYFVKNHLGGRGGDVVNFLLNNIFGIMNIFLKYWMPIIVTKTDICHFGIEPLPEYEYEIWTLQILNVLYQWGGYNDTLKHSQWQSKKSGVHFFFFFGVLLCQSSQAEHGGGLAMGRGNGWGLVWGWGWGWGGGVHGSLLWPEAALPSLVLEGGPWAVLDG